MSGDFNLYFKGILNQFPLYSVAHVTTGSVTVATATITIGGAYVNRSAKSGSVYAAYLDLWERLNDGQVGLIPSLTTAEIALLTSVNDGVPVIDKTLGRLDICIAGAFAAAGGTTNPSVSNYAALYENNLNGSAMESTSKLWNSALVGVVASAVGMTLASDSTSSRATITTAGDKHVAMFASFTNAGGNLTTATIMKNGVATTLTVAIQGDSGKHRELVINGVLSSLAINDILTLKIVSATPSDVIKVYQCHLNFNLG